MRCAYPRLPPTRRFGGAERRGPACGTGDAPDDGISDDEGAAAAEAAMLTEEEALLVTNRLHQVALLAGLASPSGSAPPMPTQGSKFSRLPLQVLRPFMLRRLKESVVAELPQKSERLLPGAAHRGRAGLCPLASPLPTPPCHPPCLSPAPVPCSAAQPLPAGPLRAHAARDAGWRGRAGRQPAGREQRSDGVPQRLQPPADQASTGRPLRRRG